MGPAQSRLSKVRRLSWLNLTISWREPRALRGCVEHGAALWRQRQSIGHLAASGREKRCERRRGTVEASADGGTPFAFELKDSDPLETGEDRRFQCRSQIPRTTAGAAES
jgi:hypothetical protein